MFDGMRMSDVQVGRDEARVSGHAVLFSVRCSKFVDIVSSHTSPSPAQPQQPGLTVTLSGVTR